MAERAHQLNPWPGIGAAILVVALVLLPLTAVVTASKPGTGLGPADWAAVRFTICQAFLSAILSVALAVPLARALARRQFPGRALLVTLLGAPFILPVLVAVMGLLAVFGRAGLGNAVLTTLGFDPVSIYGLHGVVLAHVFFNLPLATRLLLMGWQGIPAERFRLAAQLGFSAADTRRLLEWPMVRRTAPGAFALIFTLCLSSFAVALALGGGPRATTIELAIYQAFRFDFDLGRAALLAVVQVFVATGGAAMAMMLVREHGFGRGLDRAPQRPDAPQGLPRVLDALAIAASAAFLLIPLLMVLLRGAPGLAELPAPVWNSALVSLRVAAGSTALTLCLSLALSVVITSHRRGWLELVGFLGLALSPLVLGTGAFLLIRPLANPTDWALTVTMMLNALMALPFALRLMVPALRDVQSAYGRLGQSLGVRGGPWLRLVVLPRLRPQLGFAAGLTAALSVGDLGVIALFAGQDHVTLPLQMYRLMGAYRMDDAAAAAVLLLALALAAFWAFDAWGRRRA